MFSELVGLCAGTCTTLTFVPQAVKVWREKDKAEGVSLSTVFTNLVGVCLWVLYGVMRRDDLIVAFNSVNVVVSSVLLALYLRVVAKRGERRASVGEDDAGSVEAVEEEAVAADLFDIQLE